MNAMLIRMSPPWLLPEREATDECDFVSRRRFLQTTLAAAAGAALLDCGDSPIDPRVAGTIPKTSPPYPFPRNARYTLDRKLTRELVAAQYNNFYEFSAGKDVWQHTQRFLTSGWSLDVTGLVAKPLHFSIDELLHRFAPEERLYRHRCVEAWSMAVPWSGFPLSKLLALAEPKHEARYVRFVSFSDAAQQPGVAKQPWYPWPYYEGLRIDEAMHELTFLATGIYGHPLPKQHGAPIRLVVPWKYGYKSAKSITRIELTAEKPHTFWNDLAPAEYSFQSNVDPHAPHPRWSQESERLIGSWDVRRTMKYNGYGALVGSLYG
jgi:sulfoxide reductase catalytic subunit YedY